MTRSDPDAYRAELDHRKEELVEPEGVLDHLTVGLDHLKNNLDERRGDSTTARQTLRFARRNPAGLCNAVPSCAPDCGAWWPLAKYGGRSDQQHDL
jgi:hypothetical protein